MVKLVTLLVDKEEYEQADGCDFTPQTDGT